MEIPDNATLLPMGQQPEQPPLSAIQEHPANHYLVGMRVPLGEETWIITALDFIFNKAILRPCDGDNGPINYDGERREIPLMELPWES